MVGNLISKLSNSASLKTFREYLNLINSNSFLNSFKKSLELNESIQHQLKQLNSIINLINLITSAIFSLGVALLIGSIFIQLLILRHNQLEIQNKANEEQDNSFYRSVHVPDLWSDKMNIYSDKNRKSKYHLSHCHFDK